MACVIKNGNERLNKTTLTLTERFSVKCKLCPPHILKQLRWSHLFLCHTVHEWGRFRSGQCCSLALRSQFALWSLSYIVDPLPTVHPGSTEWGRGIDDCSYFPMQLYTHLGEVPNLSPVMWNIAFAVSYEVPVPKWCCLPSQFWIHCYLCCAIQVQPAALFKRLLYSQAKRSWPHTKKS